MAEAASKPKNLLVTLAFVVFGGPGIVVVYLPAWITRWRVRQQPWGWRLLAGALIAIGLLPLGESIARFVSVGRGTLSPSHPTETLVATGFYRHVRNPMYIGVLALIAGQCVLFRSWPLFAYLGCIALAVHLFVMFYEEPTLRKKYGASYDEFRRNVPRWLPRIKPWSGAG
jgi:protein-S-isoprenylcysteine O-methyltransferase Ste14